MKAIQLKAFGAADNLYIGTAEQPTINDFEILVKVHATALNRADTLQRKGVYPAPKGASNILGLEMSGEIVALGKQVTQWKIGDAVCGLLSGGGYAEYVATHENMVMPVPKGLTTIEAAAIPEVFLTAFQALRWLANLQPEDSLLLHAGASGVGTAAIQLAKTMGCTSISVTASARKHKACLALGATLAIDYPTQNFETVLQQETNGQGVNVIVDFLAAPYFQQNLNTLSTDGRMVMLALMGGIKTEVNLIPILRKRLKIQGSTLRARTLDYKVALTKDFATFALPLFENQTLRPVIDSVFDWSEVAQAHTYMEANKNIGKIILKVS